MQIFYKAFKVLLYQLLPAVLWCNQQFQFSYRIIKDDRYARILLDVQFTAASEIKLSFNLHFSSLKHPRVLINPKQNFENENDPKNNSQRCIACIL